MRTVFSFLLISMTFVLYSCKSADDKPLVRNQKPWDKLILNVEDIEERKAAEKKVKERITYTKFYNKFSKLDTKAYLVERIFYNEDGQKEKHIQYLSTGEVDVAWEYEYENTLTKRITAKNRYDQLVYERLIKFDSEWDEVEIKEYNQKSKDYNKTLVSYDKMKFVKEIYNIDNHGNQLSKQTIVFKDKKMTKINEYDKLNRLESVLELQYDSAGKLIKESRENKISNIKTIKTIKYKDGKIYQIEDNEMLITYDYKSNDIINEHFFIPGVGPQRRFDYFYNKKGLMKTKVSVSGMGKPELHIYFRYKYY